MRVQRLSFLILMIVLAVGLAACGGQAPAPENNSPVELGGDNAIFWPREASHVIFQIDVVGGEDTFARRNNIPLCTIYGDNRIVWVDTSQPGRTIVLFDVLDDLRIYDFVSDLSVNYRIFTYGQEAALQLDDDGIPPFYEQITLHVNDREHVTDSFVQWPSTYFRDILNECRNLSTAPALFEPSGAWISASYAEYDSDATIVTWNDEISGISLLALADYETRVWVDDSNLPILWNIMTNSPDDRLFQDNNGYVEVALEVPNVHAQSPQAPTAEELDDARRMPNLLVEETEEE